MKYHLLTGATGLLGAYLLHDLLESGQRVAVLVRSSPVETARQRIETILANWERNLGYTLPRPPVLEGDIRQEDLGLDAAGIQWVADHCVSVLHNAASLSFEADPRSGEPFRSNAEGTRNVLELCRKAGIRQFHHVSTAFVCGLRSGRVLETELDVGQQSGNDYERSKILAEKMVREADFLTDTTIYRPATIIGDSKTGYTATFHGFYAPLKIGQTLVDRFGVTEIEGSPWMAALEMNGRERKNLVPVDWISRVITHIHGYPEYHGRCYHVTPAHPTSAAVVCSAIEKALVEYARTAARPKTAVPGQEQLREVFLAQMAVYRSHWRDDPVFDDTNLSQVASHLPCPDVDFEMLLRTSLYALRTNFGWPKPKAIVPEFDVAEHLRGAMLLEDGPNLPPADLRVGLQVNGPGGGQWTLLVQNNQPLAARLGLAEQLHGLLYLNSKTYQRCARGELSCLDAAQRGFLATEGTDLSRQQLVEICEATMARGTLNSRAEASTAAHQAVREHSRSGARSDR